MKIPNIKLAYSCLFILSVTTPPTEVGKLPLFACKKCQKVAKEEYESRKTNVKYNYIYLQDSSADDFWLYSTKMHNKRVY